jgi:hypothetical protein
MRRHHTVIYEKTPYRRDLPGFHIKIEWSQATVEPKDHFATAEEARTAIEPLLRAWELEAALKHDNPDVLRFDYLAPDIIDTNPTPGVAQVRDPAWVTFRRPEEPVSVNLGGYPEPPEGLFVGPEDVAAAMFRRWSNYVKDRTRLGDAANLCLTLLEGSTLATNKKRLAAATKYTIDLKVLNEIGRLAATKGGPRHGRKGEAVVEDYTESEIAWLEAALKKIIRCAAEIADDPGATRPVITMDDLPDLRGATNAKRGGNWRPKHCLGG